jgi:hypothetical protein
MPSFKYTPTGDEPEIIRTHNRTFKAGDVFEVDDKDPLLTKFRGHPQFSVEGEDAEGPAEVNKQQAELNASARDDLASKRREIGDARRKAQQDLAKAEAEERNVGLSERALGDLSPAEIRAMDQVRGTSGAGVNEEGEPVVQDGISGGGVVGRQGGQGTAGGLEPDNQAKAEGRPQR